VLYETQFHAFQLFSVRGTDAGNCLAAFSILKTCDIVSYRLVTDSFINAKQ